MKTDLLVGGLFIVLAALGLGGVVVYTSWTQEVSGPQTILPKTEPIAEFKKKVAEPMKAVAIEKKLVPQPRKVDEKPKAVPKLDLEPLPPPRPEIKVEPKKEEKRPDPPPEKKQPAVKAIVLGNVTKLNDPGGEYIVETMNGVQEITLLGKIKTLKIDGVNERSVLDATRLDAEEIVMTGDINSGSKVLLGKARTLKIRSLNDQSLLDASELDGQNVFVSGAVNSRSTLKLHAPKGSVTIDGEINGNSQVEIIAKNLDLRGAVNGPQTFILLTLTKAGSLQFRRLSGGVRLQYRKADPSDPAPRIDRGEVDARADLRELPAK
jgi:hypothetical protein